MQLAALAVLGGRTRRAVLGYSWFWTVFALGFAVSVPAVKLATDALGADAETDADTRFGGARETRASVRERAFRETELRREPE